MVTLSSIRFLRLTFKLSRISAAAQLRHIVCNGFAQWLMLSLEATPAADPITDVAEHWVDDLLPKREWGKLFEIGDVAEGHHRTHQLLPFPDRVTINLSPLS
jgi:hypothetical protein